MKKEPNFKENIPYKLADDQHTAINELSDSILEGVPGSNMEKEDSWLTT